MNMHICLIILQSVNCTHLTKNCSVWKMGIFITANPVLCILMVAIVADYVVGSLLRDFCTAEEEEPDGLPRA